MVGLLYYVLFLMMGRKRYAASFGNAFGLRSAESAFAGFGGVGLYSNHLS